MRWGSLLGARICLFLRQIAEFSNVLGGLRSANGCARRVNVEWRNLWLAVAIIPIRENPQM